MASLLSLASPQKLVSPVYSQRSFRRNSVGEAGQSLWTLFWPVCRESGHSVSWLFPCLGQGLGLAPGCEELCRDEGEAVDGCAWRGDTVRSFLKVDTGRSSLRGTM